MGGCDGHVNSAAAGHLLGPQGWMLPSSSGHDMAELGPVHGSGGPKKGGRRSGGGKDGGAAPHQGGWSPSPVTGEGALLSEVTNIPWGTPLSCSASDMVVPYTATEQAPTMMPAAGVNPSTQAMGIPWLPCTSSFVAPLHCYAAGGQQAWMTTGSPTQMMPYQDGSPSEGGCGELAQPGRQQPQWPSSPMDVVDDLNGLSEGSSGDQQVTTQRSWSPYANVGPHASSIPAWNQRTEHQEGAWSGERTPIQRSGSPSPTYGSRAPALSPTPPWTQSETGKVVWGGEHSPGSMRSGSPSPPYGGAGPAVVNVPSWGPTDEGKAVWGGELPPVSVRSGSPSPAYGGGVPSVGNIPSWGAS